MRAEIEAVLQAWDSERATTLDTLRAIPGGSLELRPATNDGWRLGDLAWHICVAESWFCTRILGVPQTDSFLIPNSACPNSSEEMANAFEKSCTTLMSTVRNLGEAWIDSTADFGGAQWPRLQILHLMLRHEAHHRGQLSVYLWLSGATSPKIYGDADAGPDEFHD